MKKIVVLVVSSFLFLAGSQAFAQFKQLSKSALNMKQLQSVIARGSANSFMKNSWQVEVPAHFVSAGKIGLLPVHFPKQITPVTVTFIDKLFADYADDPLANVNVITMAGDHLAREKGMQFVVGKDPAGKAFYEDQSELARDLDRFYEGKAEEKIGPDGRRVKLYPLPVNGILYKEVVYQVPVVLDPENYFVIYDVQTKTGKIADNEPQLYELFLTSGEYEHLQKAKASAKEMVAGKDLSLTKEDPFLSATYTYNKEVYALDRAVGRWKKTWEDMGFPSEFHSQPELGRALKTFHMHMGTKIRRKGAPEISYIFEIPVRGLTYTDIHGNLVEIDPDNEVFWYLDDNIGSLIKRSDLEEGDLFEYVG